MTCNNISTFSSLNERVVYTLCWLFLCLLFIPGVLFSQQQIHFSQLTQSYTNCIIKDSDGFIWVGTQDGLLRYDNYRFKVFRYQSEDQYSLRSNWVKDIVEDKNKDLWIGTFGGGLIRWDRSLERFYSYTTISGTEFIHSLAINRDSILLIGSENGLIEFNINSKTSLNHHSFRDEESNFINDIYVSLEGEVFLGTNAGLIKHSESKDQIQRLLDDEDIIVYCIDGRAHRIYIGTNKGLYIYNKRKKSFENQLSDKSVAAILLSSQDQWYLGTNTGIAIYKEGEGYSWYKRVEGDQNSLKSDLIHSLYYINEELIWTATRNGVHQFSVKPPDFQSLQKQYNNKGCSNNILGMAEDKNSDVWICSRDGLMHFKVSAKVSDWTGYCHKSSNTVGMNSSYTINITEDANKDLWLAYRNNGFSKITEKDGEWVWENYPKAIAKLNGDGVNQVFQDMSGRYWLASRGKGLIRFYPYSEDLEFYDESDGLSHPYIFRIHQTEKGILWLSTANGGLCKYDIESNKFECSEVNRKEPASISANMVLATNRQSNGNLLVCTTEGLNILNNENSFDKINTLDGLPNNVIYAVLEDDNSNIWVSTNEGISKLDLSLEIPKVTNYNKSHGLSSSEFNQHSYLEHSSGLFLFGGVEGVTVFDPLDVESRKVIPNIAITNFELFNKSVPIQSERKGEFSIEKSINQIDKIDLDYNQNSLGFEYSALGITNSENTIYQYKLDGLENDWVNAGQRNYAPYPNIPYGDYIFRVRLTDLNNNPISKEKTVEISIATPPWLTWWAYVVYFALLMGILYFLARIQKDRTLAIAKARENERDVFRKKLARDFHDEAGNKITRISLITDNLTRKSKNNDLVLTLNKLQDNIQDLRLGMTDFIWVLDPGKDSLGETLRRFMDFANDTFEDGDIDFAMETIPSNFNDIVMPSNVRRHFLLIMKEAITNILKHSKSDLVRFTFSNKDNIWTFNMIDNGKGFDIAELDRINGLNNMRTRAEKIGGTLEVESKIDAGSKISLTVKL